MTDITIEPTAWRLRNTSFRRQPHYEYFDTKDAALQRQADFNRAVDDGSLVELTALIEEGRIAPLLERVRSADEADRQLNEALNSGDGVYRP